jgi:hypothetical protein
MRLRLSDVLGQAVGRFGVAHDDELLAPFGRSQHVRGIDRPAVRRDDWSPFDLRREEGTAAAHSQTRKIMRRSKDGTVSPFDDAIQTSKDACVVST